MGSVQSSAKGDAMDVDAPHSPSGAPCRYEAEVVFHDPPCGCSVCDCDYTETKDLAWTLSRVSFVFRELVGGRQWHCRHFGGWAPTQALCDIIDAFGGSNGLVESVLDRVRICRLSPPNEREDGKPRPGYPWEDRFAEGLRHMRGLERLMLYAYGDSSDVAKFLEAAAVCVGLRSLRLDSVGFSADSLRVCLGATRNLAILCVAGKIVLEDASIFDALAESVPASLESLTISQLCENDFLEELSEDGPPTMMLDRHLLRIVEAANDLKVLDLSGSAKLTDASVAPALANHAGLRRVCFNGCAGITDASLSVLVASRLRELSLDSTGVSDASVVLALQRNADLRTVNLRNSADAIVPHLTPLLPTLWDLSVSGTAVTWPALRPLILAKPPKLKHLAISRIRGVDDDAVRCIRDNLGSLESLRMGGCAGITRAEVLLYMRFKLQDTLGVICLEGVPVADGDLVDAMERIKGDGLFYTSRD
ncbi:hypothetical protein DFJ74DRAFT_773323 [Hyaloraphidium curvatum]|nr:hypothetical protein DFJ74DRAFT_773323 [Hyaloraphidium curvatum]